MLIVVEQQGEAVDPEDVDFFGAWGIIIEAYTVTDPSTSSGQARSSSFWGISTTFLPRCLISEACQCILRTGWGNACIVVSLSCFGS